MADIDFADHLVGRGRAALAGAAAYCSRWQARRRRRSGRPSTSALGALAWALDDPEASGAARPPPATAMRACATYTSTRSSAAVVFPTPSPINSTSEANYGPSVIADGSAIYIENLNNGVIARIDKTATGFSDRQTVPLGGGFSVTSPATSDDLTLFFSIRSGSTACGRRPLPRFASAIWRQPSPSWMRSSHARIPSSSIASSCSSIATLATPSTTPSGGIPSPTTGDRSCRQR